MILSSSSGVKHQLAPTESGYRRDCHVVGGGPQPAARDDQVHSLVGQKAQLSLDVVRTITADGDVREFDPKL